MNRILFIPATVLLGLLADPSYAQFGSFEEPTEQPDRSSAALISEHTALVAGQTNTLALAFDLDPGWHLYWDGQNDTGMPVSIRLEGSADWNANPTLAPTPERHVSPGDLLDHVLTGAPVLMIPIAVADDAAGSSITIRGRASWLVCKEACILDEETFEMTLPVISPGQALTDSADAEIISAARDRLPRSEEDRPDWLGVEWIDGRLILSTTTPGTLEFYPASDSIPVADLLTTGSATTGSLTLTMDRSPTPKRPAIRGVVGLRLEDGTAESAWVRTTPATE